MNKPALTAFVAVLILASLATAGSLTPPGSPASTMNTLEELFDSIAGTFDSSAVVADQDGSLIEHLKYIEENMGGGVSSDSLDFDEFVDNMTLDADLTVASSGFDTTWNGNTYFMQGNVGIGTTTFANGNVLAVTGTTPLAGSVMDYATVQVSSAPSTTAAGSVAVGLWSTMTNTTSTAGGSGQLIGLFGNSTDTASGRTTMYGVEARVDGRSTAIYTGASISYLGITAQSHYQGVRGNAGTLHIGAEGLVSITSDGTTPSVTGTAISFYAPAITGGALKYSFYGNDIIRTLGGLESPGAGASSFRAGSLTTADGAFAVAVGDSNTVGASHTGSIVIGYSQSSTAANQMVVGSSNANTAYINDVYIGSGVTDTSPVAVTYNGTGGSGSNVDGADIRIAGGKGTGLGVGGSVVLQTAPAGSTGSTPNALIDRMVIISSGSVGIGATSPGKLLHVQSAIEGSMFRLQDTDGTCDLDPDSGGLTTSCSSDERLKSDIEEAPSMLAYLGGFHIKEYTIRTSGNRMIGVIAQELQETHPELVSVGPNGLLMVREPSTWQLIKAIQELSGRIDSLASEGPISIEGKSWFAGIFGRIVDRFALLLGIEFKEEGYIRAQTLCLDDVCVTKDELRQLLDQADIQGGSTPDDD